jgi:hypothetical protein
MVDGSWLIDEILVFVMYYQIKPASQKNRLS